MARTIQSPGVEVNEVDLSLRPVVPTGTDILVTGYAAQGPTDEALEVTSFSEFEQVYGKPTNSAERYFYHSAKNAFNSDGRVITARLPYGAGDGQGFDKDYSALIYPVYAHDASAEVVATSAQHLSGDGAGLSLSAADSGFVFGKPTLVKMNEAIYQKVAAGDFTWYDSVTASQTFSTGASADWGKAGMIVLNKGRTTINDKYEGYYVGITDSAQLNPATSYDSFRKIGTVNANNTDGHDINSITIPSTRLRFALTGTSTDATDSLSETIEDGIPSFELNSTEFKDTLVVGVVKLRQSTLGTDPLVLDFSIPEGYVGSLDSFRQVNNTTGGTPKSFFLGEVENSSPNVEILINPHISTKSGTWQTGSDNNPSKFVQMRIGDGSGGFLDSGVNSFLLDYVALPTIDGLAPLGTYQKADPGNKVIGNTPTKLNRLFENSALNNLEVVNVDVSIEGGLGTVYAGAQALGTVGYDEEENINIGVYADSSGVFKISEGLTTEAGALKHETYRDSYRLVFNEFKDFAEQKRKDHIHIADVPRHLLVQGENAKALDDKSKSFSQAIYWPLKHVFGAYNTSYVSVYGNWGRNYDAVADKFVYTPFSAIAAATYANVDGTFQPWFAPAGFTRGRFSGAVNLAIKPSQRQRDLLYRIGVNPVTQFPNEGFAIFGQKTLFKKPSAFDRVNVRRLFLYLEKVVRNTMRFFVFEPNTLLTRTQVVNILTPIFENAKNTEGVFDYLIVCDERNNTPDIIDQNELVVDIYLKPVRAAEFILVNFYATRTGQDFNELLS